MMELIDWSDFDIEHADEIAVKNLKEELAKMKEQYPQLQLNVEVKNQPIELNPLDVLW